VTPDICPACQQVIAPSGLRLPPIKAKIYDAVRRRPGITAQELRDWVWSDDIDGGPLTAAKCLHVHVSQLNDLLRARGITVRSEGGGYFVKAVS
jgi:hypothetical protein